MIKQSECIGLPIISEKEGEIVGRVQDFLISDKDKSIFGFILEGNLFSGEKIILLENVLKMGKDAIVVDNKDVVSNLKVDINYKMKDKEVYTKDGINLGMIKDIRVNEENGEIECVEISDGIISDIINGRRVLPLIGKVLFSDNNIIVEKQAYEEIESSSKGINNYLGAF
ncbi:MAG: PRC-barrel domain-containing protein [Clostridiales bacterium]|nr:PRC-barrel domain-containing protein [Clostridiales bacterium]